MHYRTLRTRMHMGTMGIPSLASAIRTHSAVDHAREVLVLGQAILHAWDRLLWLGCGDGWGPEEAWRRMRKGYVCGMERSPEQVRRAHQLRGIPGNVEFRSWDGHTLPLERSFNHVISCGAVGSSPRPDGLLREISRVLVPGGSLSLIEATCHKPTRTAHDMFAMLLGAGFVEVACMDDGYRWLVGGGRRPQ